jgi:hypothetical protein
MFGAAAPEVNVSTSVLKLRSRKRNNDESWARGEFRF